MVIYVVFFDYSPESEQITRVVWVLLVQFLRYICDPLTCDAPIVKRRL